MKAIKFILLAFVIGGILLIATSKRTLALYGKSDSYSLERVDSGFNVFLPLVVKVCPNVLAFGQTVQCPIGTPGTRMAFTFSAVAGDRIRIRMLDTSGSIFSPIFRLYRPDGTEVCYGYGDPVANTNCTLNVTGTYTILAGDNSGQYTGSFSLFLERLNNPGLPTPITFGQTLSGSINTQPELKAFTFSAVAGDRVRMRMLDTSGSIFSPIFWLYRPDGTEVCYGYGDPVANTNCALNVTGTYTILAGDNSGQYTGSFSLFLERLNNPGLPTPITFGQTLSGSINTQPELKAFTFSAVAGDQVRMRMLDTSGSIFSPIFWLYRPDGTEVCYGYGDPVANTNCTLNVTGTYTILAGDNSGQYTGSFSLFLERLNNPGLPTPITFGQTLSGSINTQPELKAFTFSAVAGDQVRMRMLDTSGSIFSPIFWLYRPDGTEVCYGYGDPVANTNCALNVTGTYTILAGDNSGQYTGSFSLFLERLNNPGLPTPITFGQTLSGSINTQPELKAFTFSAVAGDRVRMRMLDTSGSIFSPIFWLYRPDGTEVCYGYGDPVANTNCTLNVTGTYTILAGDNSGQYTGSFSLFLERLNNPGLPTPITFGQTLSGSINTQPELKAFTFSAVAGDRVRMRTLDTSGSIFSPIFWLYRPDGTEVCYGYGDPVANTNCTLNVTGTYTILAGDNSGQYTGSFSLFLECLNNPGLPTPITFGQTLSGSINTQPELKAFTFSAVTGNQVRISMSDTSGSIFSPIFWLYRPDGTEVCYGYGDPVANTNCTLNATGAYTILAGDNSGQYTGSFSLFLEHLNNP